MHRCKSLDGLVLSGFVLHSSNFEYTQVNCGELEVKNGEFHIVCVTFVTCQMSSEVTNDKVFGALAIIYNKIESQSSGGDVAPVFSNGDNNNVTFVEDTMAPKAKAQRF